MADAVYDREFDERRLVAGASIGVREVWQMPDGLAAVYIGIPNGQGIQEVAATTGDRVDFRTAGKWTVTKTTGVAFLDGGRVYWDHSANSATYKKVNDRDFYIGRAVGDYSSSDPTLIVDLNSNPPDDIDLLRDAALVVPVGTQAVGGFGFPKVLGGALSLELTATNEAQKIDLLSVDGFAKAANAIVEFIFRIPDDGAGTAADFNIGAANATHATDADSIAEHIFFHLDANATSIHIQSKDGSTTVAAVDSTEDYTEGSAVANRVEGWIDFRNPADVQVYVNGENVASGSTFNLDAVATTLFLLAHLEKTSSTDVYRAVIDAFRVRFMEQ